MPIGDFIPGEIVLRYVNPSEESSASNQEFESSKTFLTVFWNIGKQKKKVYQHLQRIIDIFSYKLNKP